MIRHVTGNILDSSADALVNTVNTVGVMGKGIALQFRQAFPDNYDAYVRACERGEVQPGHMFVFHRLTHPRWIINFPTKRDWRHRARMADIESGLKALIETVRHEDIKSNRRTSLILRTDTHLACASKAGCEMSVSNGYHDSFNRGSARHPDGRGLRGARRADSRYFGRIPHNADCQS